MVITRTSSARLGSVAVVALVYLLSAVPLIGWLGPNACALSVLPVGYAGALCGRRAGIAAAFLSVLVNTLLLNLASYPGWDSVVRSGGDRASSPCFRSA
jgi:hypothetical protein